MAGMTTPAPHGLDPWGRPIQPGMSTIMPNGQDVYGRTIQHVNPAPPPTPQQEAMAQLPYPQRTAAMEALASGGGGGSSASRSVPQGNPTTDQYGQPLTPPRLDLPTAEAQAATIAPMPEYKAPAPPPPAPVYSAPVAPTPANTKAASDAAYSQAKDKVAATSRASMTALRGSMAERGLSGSGIEGKGTRDIVQSGAAQLDDVARGQAQTDLTRAQSVEDRNYAGGLSSAATAYQGGVATRGQDISAASDAAAGANAYAGAAAANKRASLQTLASMRAGGSVY